MSSTIKDVARLARVSISTVSRVQNGSANVRPETRERILQAFRQLDYEPNAVARSMIKKTTQSIGVIIPDITNPFFPAVIKGIEDLARKLGFSTILCNTDESVEDERKALQILRQKRVDGLIITAADEKGLHIKKAAGDGLPVVLVDRLVEEGNLDAVLIDNVFGAYQAARHLILQGHKKLGVIAGPQNLTPGRDRLQGFKKALREYGVQIEERYMKFGDFREESGYVLGRQLLEAPSRPTAIFACNNLMTIGLIRAILGSGLRIGVDIAVVGFDDIEIATMLNPPITVVTRPMYKMGSLAFELLMERIEGNGPEEGRKVILIPELVVRGSCRLAGSTVVA